MCPMASLTEEHINTTNPVVSLTTISREEKYYEANDRDFWLFLYN